MDFAQQTKHRNINDCDLRMKMLATQIPEVRQVYPYIANDWNSIEFRAPGVLESYKMPPKELERLLGNCTSDSPLLKHFAEQVEAPKGKELVTFFARKYPENALHLDGPVYHNLKKHTERYDPEELAQLIQSIQWVGSDGTKESEEPEEEEEEEEEKEPVKSMVTAVPQLPIRECKEWVDSEHRLHPAIVKHRMEADLPGRFPSDKIAKQIVFQHMGQDVLPYMGKQQIHLPATPVDESIVKVVVDHLIPKEDIESMISTPEAKKLYCSLRPSDGRDLAIAMILKK
jgi:hypothetical protein